MPETPRPDHQADQRVWFVTGASRGFGREIARAALETGDRVVATAREPQALAALRQAWPDDLMTLRLDVTYPDEIAAAIRETEETCGGIDVLVNNAGYGYLSAIEEGEDDEIRALFETNLFGLAAVTRAALPGMRRRGSGVIVNMSSGGGFFGLPGSGYYAATKFAVEGFSESLQSEIGPLGMHVLLVEPGAFRTDWAGRSLRQCPTFLPEYEATAGQRRRAVAASHGHQPGDPARAARAILQAVRSPEPPFRLVLGADALANARDKVVGVMRDHNAWEEVSVATDIITSGSRP
jgi:NAD(P)-dependent dehydrogenase (short-subunit alcohol dehydrogenase family)